jgi:hypothetical protein
MPIGLKGNTDGSGAVQIGGSDAISISTGLNTTFAGTITATGTVAGTTGTLYPLVSGTAVASTSGTAIDFTGIPSWVRRITVMFSGVSTTGSSNYQIQIGTSGGIQITGYLVNATQITAAAAASTTSTAGFRFGSSAYNVGTDTFGGMCQICLLDSSNGTWTAFGCIGNSAAAQSYFTAGSKVLSGTLDRVRITTAGGTDTFDAGTINILYE